MFSISTNSSCCHLLFRSCAHFADWRKPHANGNTRKCNSVGSLVLSHNNIVTHLLQALNSFKALSPLTLVQCIENCTTDVTCVAESQNVGDVIFQVLCTLNKKARDVMDIVKPLYYHLSNTSHGE